MSCGVDGTCGPDLAWLWLWPAATALIQPLAREPPRATGMALKRHTHKKVRKAISQDSFFSHPFLFSFFFFASVKQDLLFVYLIKCELHLISSSSDKV